MPNIAILDWENLPTSSEFVLLRNHFTARGVPTIICSPDNLEYQSGELRCGAFHIDLVYKRVIIHEFLARYDETHPLIRAYVNHDVCLVNPFRCKIIHKKAVFEMLTDDEHQHWFTGSEKAVFSVTRCRGLGASPIGRRHATDAGSICSNSSVEIARFLFSNQMMITEGTAFISARD